MANSDLLLKDNDLVTDSTGDFATGASDEQHVQDTINSFAGWWKENYADGVGALQYLGSTGQEQVIARAVKINLQSDGYEVSNPQVYFDAQGNLVIIPNATKN